MKKSVLLTLTITASLLVATAAHAQCEIQLSESQVAYAPVTRGELLAYPGNSLTSGELRIGDARDLDITVSCDRSTAMALAFNGAAKDSESYRFGAEGRATLLLHDVFIDNQPVTIDSAGQQLAEIAFTPGNTLRFWQNNRLVSGITLRGKVSITAWMPAKATRVKERENWELNGVFVTGSTLN